MSSLPVWFYYAIFSALTFSIINILDKFVVDSLENPLIPLLFTILINTVAGIFVFYFYKVPLITASHIIIAIIISICYMIMIFFYFKALKIEEASRVIPFFLLAPMFVSLFAGIFLKEILTKEQYFGISLLILGAILISYKGKLALGKAAFFMILGSIFLAIDITLTKYLINNHDYITIYGYTSLGTLIGLIPIWLMVKKDLNSSIKKMKYKLGLLIFSDMLSLVGCLLFYIAASLGPITIIEAVRSTQPLFVFLFALIISVFYPKILKEQISKNTLLLKIIAILLMALGSYLVIK